MDPIRPINPNEPRFQILPARPARQVSHDQRRAEDEQADPRRDPDHPEPEDSGSEESGGEDSGGEDFGDTGSGAETGTGELAQPLELNVYDGHGVHEHLANRGSLDIYDEPAAAPADHRDEQPAGPGDDRPDGGDGADPPIRHIDISA